MASSLQSIEVPVVGIGAVVLIASLASITVNLFWRLLSDHGIPRHLQWAGTGRSGRLSRLRANLRSLLGMKELMLEGHAKFSKKNEVFVLPNMIGGPEVVLPLAYSRWLCEQPETNISQTEVNRRFLEADHTFPHHNIVREPVHPEVIRRELTRELNSFADDIVDELGPCLERNWGTDTENWREIKPYDTMLDVITRLSTRVLVGEPLCKNEEFLRSARHYDQNVVLHASALNMLPEFIKPIFAPILCFRDYLRYRIMAKFIMPVIKERLAQTYADEEKSTYTGPGKPNDYIQWAIDHARNHPDPLELSPSLIAKRFACLCFAAIQSSVIIGTNVLFDIAATPNCEANLSTLRDEVMSTVSSQSVNSSTTKTRSGQESSRNSAWGKASLARMVHVDSAIRESLRMNGFIARGIMKMVTAPGGVTLPDGTHLPKGVKVGIQGYSIHHDDEYYPEAERYDAFRFVPGTSSRSSSASGAESESGGENGRGEVKKRQGRASGGSPEALVTTSATFMGFSHGPNACPGRFFAANQLKLTLAHIALHYEIQPIPERPVNRWLAGNIGAPMWETLRVRRRKME